MKQYVYKMLAELEGIQAAAERAAACRSAPSGMEVFLRLLSRCAVVPLTGESIVPAADWFGNRVRRQCEYHRSGALAVAERRRAPDGSRGRLRLCEQTSPVNDSGTEREE